MKKIAVLLFAGFFLCIQLSAQINAGLFRFPMYLNTDRFSYANDVWIMPKEAAWL